MDIQALIDMVPWRLVLIGLASMVGLVVTIRVMRRGLSTFEEAQHSMQDRIRKTQTEIMEGNKSTPIAEHVHLLDLALQEMAALAGREQDITVTAVGQRVVVAGDGYSWDVTYMPRVTHLHGSNREVHGTGMWHVRCTTAPANSAASAASAASVVAADCAVAAASADSAAGAAGVEVSPPPVAIAASALSQASADSVADSAAGAAHAEAFCASTNPTGMAVQLEARAQALLREQMHFADADADDQMGRLITRQMLVMDAVHAHTQDGNACGAYTQGVPSSEHTQDARQRENTQGVAIRNMPRAHGGKKILIPRGVPVGAEADGGAVAFTAPRAGDVQEYPSIDAVVLYLQKALHLPYFEGFLPVYRAPVTQMPVKASAHGEGKFVASGVEHLTAAPQMCTTAAPDSEDTTVTPDTAVPNTVARSDKDGAGHSPVSGGGKLPPPPFSRDAQ